MRRNMYKLTSLGASANLTNLTNPTNHPIDLIEAKVSPPRMQISPKRQQISNHKYNEISQIITKACPFNQPALEEKIIQPDDKQTANGIKNIYNLICRCCQKTTNEIKENRNNYKIGMEWQKMVCFVIEGLTAWDSVVASI